MNDRLLKVIRRESVDMTPIWIMRQAGRYLPEYRAVRAKAGSFLALCKNPELACEVTLQPLRRFPLDAAILFSDILTIPDAMGLGLSFKEGEGPCFANPIHNARDINNLQIPEPEEKLQYVLQTVHLIKSELANKVPLIGFCGSPWTLACYMVEGQAKKSFPTIKKLQTTEPQLLHQLLELLADAVSAHLNAQIKAGVDVVMLFDTWGGLLNTADYREFSLRYCKKIFANIAPSVPKILFTKEGGQWLDLMATSGCEVLGVDWLTDLHKARQQVGEKIILQGNMDPQFLYRTPAEIRAEVARILDSFGEGSGHIFNLGHGILPDIPVDNVAIFIDAVHEMSQKYHAKN